MVEESPKMIIRKIMRHGGTLAIVIPAAWCREFELRRGDYVALEVGAPGEFMVAKLSASEVEQYVPKTIQLDEKKNSV